MLNIILIIIGLIAIIFGIVFVNEAMLLAGLPSIIGGLLIFVFAFSFSIIPTGYTGVSTVFGQINTETVNNGFNWKIPFVQSIEKVNNKQQDVLFEDEVWSETAERTTISYKKITVSYQINSEKSAWIFANISDYKSNLITNSLVLSSVKSASKTLSDVESTNRSIVEPLAQKYLQESVDGKYGENVVSINKIVISEADFEDSYNEAIANKQKSELAKEQQEIINEQNISKAEAEKKATITKAEGNAEAKKISAKAEAEANKTISDSITDNTLKNKMYDKWNGELPKVSGDTGIIIPSDVIE